jgi:hypothetical protein
MKKILVIYYSQSDQLFHIANSFLSPLSERPEYEICWQPLKPAVPYPFPWSIHSFYDEMPESILLEHPQIEPVSFHPDDRFDLIVLAYTVWFLSPSPPIVSFLSSTEALVMKNTPVITIVNGRNNWLLAQKRVEEMISNCGGILIDHTAFLFTGGPLTTMITTGLWLFKGEKKASRFLPAAGVHDKEIASAKRFGMAIDAAFQNNLIDGHHSILHGLGAVKVTFPMIQQEQSGYRMLSAWAKRIRKAGKKGDKNRKPILFHFRVHLLLLIVISIPLSVIYRFVAKYFFREQFKKRIRYFEGPSGSSTERIRVC